MSLDGDAEFAFVLGSGLGGAAAAFPARTSMRFEEVDGLTAPGVEGHEGAFRLSRVAGKDCLFIVGRKHSYERKNDEIRRLVRFAGSLGASKLITVSAAGSLNRHMRPGEFILADRLLNMQMRPPGDFQSGFPSEGRRAGSSLASAEGRNILSLDSGLIRRIHCAARRTGLRTHRGTIACMTGPAYETAAEVRFLQFMQADAASMSAALEIFHANCLGLDCAVLCLITNYATHISKTPLRHKEVLAVSEGACAALAKLLSELVRGP